MSVYAKGGVATQSQLIESIKTTPMEDVSTRVLEKIKNIREGKTEKDLMYQDI